MSKIVNSKDIRKGNNNIVLTEDDINNMYKPLKKENLPDSSFMLSKIQEILTFMCNNELLNVRSVDKKAYDNIIKDKFKIFSTKYPSIMELVLKGEDLTLLVEMLKKIDMVKSNKINMSQAEDSLRDKLADKYLYSNMTRKQKREIQKKMKSINKKK